MNENWQIQLQTRVGANSKIIGYYAWVRSERGECFEGQGINQLEAILNAMAHGLGLRVLPRVETDEI